MKEAFNLKCGIKQLWEGSIFASIAHAIMVAHFPELSNEHSWDGFNYNIQNSSDAKGTVTFSSNGCVGAIYHLGSKPVYNISEYFSNTPDELIALFKNEALQYLLENLDGKVQPIFTTAFWGKDSQLVSTDTHNEMIQHGGFLLENQMREIDRSLLAWKEYYDMTKKQCDLLKSIFDKKITQPDKSFRLTKNEISLIGTNDKLGLKESQVSFGELGIGWED